MRRGEPLVHLRGRAWSESPPFKELTLRVLDLWPSRPPDGFRFLEKETGIWKDPADSSKISGLLNCGMDCGSSWT